MSDNLSSTVFPDLTRTETEQFLKNLSLCGMTSDDIRSMVRSGYVTSLLIKALREHQLCALQRWSDELDLSTRPASCLKSAGIGHIWQLVGNTESEMLKTKNLGRKSLNEIKEIMDELGVWFGMPIPEEAKRR